MYSKLIDIISLACYDNSRHPKGQMNFRNRRFSPWQFTQLDRFGSGACVCALVCHAGKPEWIRRITFRRSHDAGVFCITKGEGNMAVSIHTNKKAIRLSIFIFLGLVLGALYGLIM